MTRKTLKNIASSIYKHCTHAYGGYNLLIDIPRGWPYMTEQPTHKPNTAIVVYGSSVNELIGAPQ